MWLTFKNVMLKHGWYRNVHFIVIVNLWCKTRHISILPHWQNISWFKQHVFVLAACVKGIPSIKAYSFERLSQTNCCWKLDWAVSLWEVNCYYAQWNMLVTVLRFYPWMVSTTNLSNIKRNSLILSWLSPLLVHMGVQVLMPCNNSYCLFSFMLLKLAVIESPVLQYNFLVWVTNIAIQISISEVEHWTIKARVIFRWGSWPKCQTNSSDLMCKITLM